MKTTLKINEKSIAFDKLKVTQETKVYLAYKYRLFNRKQELDNLTRANVSTIKPRTKKTIYLSKNARAIAKVVLKKILQNKTVLLNHKYLSTITLCKSDQNNNILKELVKIFHVKYYRLIKKNGVLFSYYYHFQLNENVISELKCIETLHYKAINQKSITEFFPGSYYNNNIITNYRSNNNTNYNINNTNMVELTKKAVYLLQLKQYDQKKNLAAHYPLVDRDCFKLQDSSGRSFDCKTINEILLSMSKRLDRWFYSKAQFMSYMTKVLQGELRFASKQENYSQKTISSVQKKQSKFLDQVESLSIISPSPENCLKRKWAAVLPPHQAYHLLSSLRKVQKKNNLLQIYVTQHVILTSHIKKCLLDEARAVEEFCDVTVLIIEKTKTLVD